MRSELEPFEGQRKRFQATVESFGEGRSAGRPETILLVDVRCTDRIDVVAADHLWLKRVAALRSVSIGDVIEFNADVER